ncbi:MAG: DUF4199 domain-containing protein [Tidjanibacter sp.]|nr:DUF4199 domain-containing protein [Tidjanibacter sp.]MBQ2248338.1 DUF4199 domain-containing protein [Tidjanibacter sp.]
MKRNFWLEALKGGTVVGLVSVAFSIVTVVCGDSTTLVNLLSIASTVVTILLLFGYTRRFAAMHSAEEGFSVGRAVGFVVAMMIFVGVLSGVYSAVNANFFMKAELLQGVDEVMAQMQDVVPAESFEKTYQMMRSSVTNPFIHTGSSVISHSFFGVIVGLCVGLLVRRRPDIFANTNNGQPTE